MGIRPAPALALALALTACGRSEQISTTIDSTTLAAFAALPATMESPDNPLTAAKADLGRMLYYDNRLSLNNNVSCNWCHDLAKYGTDLQRVSRGTTNEPGRRNSPTVYNAALQVAQFWDGRAATVEDQATGPILNPVEMGMPHTAMVLTRLRGNAAYRRAFRAAFPGESDPITIRNVGRAIGAFERRLVTPSRWDLFVAGDTTVLLREEREGLALFLRTGCSGCHGGVLLGGATYQKLGAARPWHDSSDIGRAAVTRAPGDTLVFKVPSLRNVDRTGPYFHDGSVATLHEAVRLMALVQLDHEMRDADVRRVVAYLGSTTGAVPLAYIRQRTAQ